MSWRKTKSWQLSVLFLFVAACQQKESSPHVGGESHLLRNCADACEDGLSCLAGICTLECDLDGFDSCAELASGAECVSKSSATSEVNVCDLSCCSSSDCSELGGDYECAENYCRAPQLEEAAVSGNGSSGSKDTGSTSTGGTGSEKVQEGSGGAEGTEPSGEGGQVASGGSPDMPSGGSEASESTGGGDGASGGSASGGAAGGEAECGNGFLELDEECDDGGLRGSDGCSDLCVIEEDFVCGEGEEGVCNRSCKGFSGSDCNGDDCCASIVIPAETVGVGLPVPSYRLDKYEVSVGRYRAYQENLETWQAAGNPLEGAGAHPEVPESGWRKAWLDELDDVQLASSYVSEGLIPQSIAVGKFYEFGTGYSVYYVEGGEALAMNEITWHMAFAFCIWDGGRLPSTAEWQFAAYGLETRTEYVWGDSPDPQEMFADRPGPGVEFPGEGEPSESWKHVSIPVGSHPASVGRFGHHDLAAGLHEWMRDTGSPRMPLNLFELSAEDHVGELKGVAGGSWELPSATYYSSPFASDDSVGFRCARDL